MKVWKIWFCLCVFVTGSSAFYYFSTPHGERLFGEETGEQEGEEAETGADKQLAAWWWQKAYPDASNITGKYREAWRQAEALKQNTAALLQQHPLMGMRRQDAVQGITGAQGVSGLGGWAAIGPKVFGGRILSIAINKSLNAAGSRTLFAGSASGGLWRSYTAGTGATAWHPVATGTHVLGVSSIVYHPTDTSTLLAGTGEVYRVESLTNGTSATAQVGNIGRNVWKARGTYGIGILKTTDAGRTWRNVMPKDSTGLFAIQKLKYDPVNSNTIYACATDGLYRSTDGGESWALIWASTYVTDVVINPANNQMLVVATGNFSNTGKGIYKSINGGATFTKVASALPIGYKGFASLAFATGTTIFASIGVDDQNGDGAYTATSEYEVYRSTDFGTTWAAITNSNHSQFQAWFAHCIMPYPGSATKLFIAGVDKHVLTISGTTGTKTNIGTGTATMATYITPGTNEGTNYVHADVHDIQFVPGSSAEAYFATDGGIFKTTNANATTISSISFSTCNGGLQVQQFYGPIAQSQATANLIIGGLQDNNVVRYNGSGWARIIGGDGGPCMFKPNNENIVIASRDARTIYQSTNGGASFSTPKLSNLGLSFTPAADERTGFMAPVAVSKANPARMYVASDNLHLSTDSGNTFTKNTPASMTTPIEATYKTAVAMGVSNLDANKLYVSTSPFAQLNDGNLRYNPPANIRKSTDGGASFSTKSTGLPDRFITDFAISPTNDENVFITLGGFGTTHIYETTDGGATWAPKGTGLPDVPFNTIMLDPVDTNILYAGSDFGVYVSQDRGVNWLDFTNGLWDATYVMDLVAAPGGKIRMATHGKGIFESPLYQVAAMPVTMVSLAGAERGNTNILQWAAAGEKAVSHYVLERSIADGRFEPVSKIAAKKRTGETAYTFNDVAAAPSCYYRLKSIATNGSYTYSNIIHLSRSSTGTLNVLGNPFRNELKIQLAVSGSGTVQFNLYDMKGALIKHSSVNTSGGVLTYQIGDLSHYPSGVYQLEALFNKQRWTQRVVKQ